MRLQARRLVLALLVFCLFWQPAISQSVVRATRLVNGKPQFLDTQGSKTPEPIDTKLDMGDYVGDLTPHANLAFTFKGTGCICTKLSSSVSIF